MTKIHVYCICGICLVITYYMYQQMASIVLQTVVVLVNRVLSNGSVIWPSVNRRNYPLKLVMGLKYIWRKIFLEPLRMAPHIHAFEVIICPVLGPFFEVHNKAIQIIYSSLLFSKHTIFRKQRKLFRRRNND